jgi:hypothetical protein
VRSAAPRNPTYREKQRRKALISAWVAQHGYVCPGWARAPHPARNLTANHITQRFFGGEDGPLEVLCMGCNVRARYMPRFG